MRHTSITQILSMILILILCTGCDVSVGSDDGGNLTGPISTVDFDCLVQSNGVIMECSAASFAGVPPLVYLWEAQPGQVPVSGAGISSVTFNYQRICESRTSQLQITVRLTITEDDGRGGVSGPVSKPFTVCTDL